MISRGVLSLDPARRIQTRADGSENRFVMEFPESLQVIAEVGIGLAGFSGLIVALRRSAGPLEEIHKFRLQVLLSLAFGAIFLSFLPELLFSFGVPANILWKISSTCLSFYSVLFLVWLISASRRLMVSHAEIFSRAVLSAIVAGHTIVVIVQLAFIFSILDVSDSAAYLLALFWYLLHSAHQFIRMLFVQPADGKQGGPSGRSALGD